MKTLLPTAAAKVVVVPPVTITAAAVASARTAALAYAAARAPSVCLDCSAIVGIMADAVAPLAQLALDVQAAGATVHLYDVPPRVALALGDALNAFSSATLSD